MKMNCTVILVGTELLNGATLDTNSIYMAEELNKYGIAMNYKLTVGDNLEKILEALKFADMTSDLVIVSGGLGATDDDLTKRAISSYLNKELIVEETELEELKRKVREGGYIFWDKSVKEVEKPVGAISIPNDVGMAPAFYIDKFAVFPGVPRELYNMFPKFLKIYSAEKNINVDEIYIKDLIVLGIPESELEERVKEYFVYPNIEYEFLVKDYGILIRLQSSLSNKNTVEKITEKIYNSIGDYIIGEDSDRVETKLISKLKEKGYTLSVAESCSGGLLSAKIVGISGVSEIFKEGVVTYSNEAKMKRLKVNEETLNSFGAVSEEIAIEMVRGLETDTGISITGIAGPDGGSIEKPVGLVYVGIRVKDKIKVIKFKFNGERNRIREKAALHSMFELSKLLEEEE